MIEVRCFHDLAAAEPYRDAMNALNRASAHPDPFATFEFYENYLDNILTPDTGTSLWLLLMFDGERLIGSLALKRQVTRVLGLRSAKLDFLTAYVAARPQLIARAEDIDAAGAAAIACLLQRKREWGLLEFQQQDNTSHLLTSRLGMTGTFRTRHWPNSPDGVIPIRWSLLTDYFTDISRKFRSNLRRQLRALFATGELIALTSSDPQTLATMFDLYCSIESRSWKSKTSDSLSQNRRWVNYYSELIRPGQPMQIIIQILTLDGIPIAGLINGSFGSDLYALHIVYDDRLERLAPGSAILLLGVRLAISRGFKHYNLLWGYGYYKSRWLAEMVDTQSLQIYKLTSPYFWSRVLGDVTRRFMHRHKLSKSERFNPARRDVTFAESKPTPLLDNTEVQQHSPTALIISPEQRERYETQLAQVHSGRGEFLSGSTLAAVLPFETAKGVTVTGSLSQGPTSRNTIAQPS